MTLLETINLSKIYQMGEIRVSALNNVSFTIEEGEFVVILGPSGSGKSTLLNLMGGMDNPTSGQIFVKGDDITNYNEKKLTEYRKDKVGFVFQFYNIMANLTAEENIEVATELSEHPLPINDILKEVGLWDRKDHFPAQLSGGEQQRISIARAVAKNPELLLCDEPTGALDYKTGMTILSLLKRLNRQMKKIVIIITHNADIALMADRVIRMRSGEIMENTINHEPMNIEDIRW